MHEELEPLKLHAVCSSSRFFVEFFVDIAQGNCAACIVQKTSLRNAASLKLYSASFVEATVVCSQFADNYMTGLLQHGVWRGVLIFSVRLKLVQVNFD